MDLPAEMTCPDCGQVQPKNRLVCRSCGGKLEVGTQKAKRLRRRRLIVDLVLGSVGLVATGSVVGIVLLNERRPLSKGLGPARLSLLARTVLESDPLDTE